MNEHDRVPIKLFVQTGDGLHVAGACMLRHNLPILAISPCFLISALPGNLLEMQNSGPIRPTKSESIFQQNVWVICVHVEFGKHESRLVVSTLESKLGQQYQESPESG